MGGLIENLINHNSGCQHPLWLNHIYFPKVHNKFEKSKNTPVKNSTFDTFKICFLNCTNLLLQSQPNISPSCYPWQYLPRNESIHKILGLGSAYIRHLMSNFQTSMDSTWDKVHQNDKPHIVQNQPQENLSIHFLLKNYTFKWLEVERK